MFSLDIRTVIVGNVIVDAVSLAVMLQLWRHNRGRYAGLGLWVADWALQLVGVVLIAGRGTVPDWASVVLANGMILGGAVALYFGLRRFAGRTLTVAAGYPVLALLVAYVAVHAHYSLVDDDLLARNLNSSIALALVCLLSMRLLLQDGGTDIRRISLGTSVAFGLIAFISLFRAVSFVLQPGASNDFLESGLLDTVLMAFLLGAIVLLVFSLMLMVNRRLLLEGRKVEEELRETGDYLNNLLDYANAPIVVWDPQFRITRFNHSFERLVGLDARDVVGKKLDAVFPEEGPGVSLASLREAAEGEYRQGVEIPVRHRDGSVLTVLWNSASLHAADGRTVVATIAQGQDITRRKRLEAQLVEANQELRALAARLQVAREEERAEVAWELHDHVAQALTVLKVDLDSCRRKLTGDQLVRMEPTLEGMARVLDETVERLRRLYADLVPVMLEDLGLAATIEWETEEFARRSGMRCEFRRFGDFQLPQGRVALGLFRALQEALENVQRHSGATRVTVDLERQGGHAVLRVTDDGRGFSGDEARKPGAVGLTGIRERALSWGGGVTVDSSPGGGTMLVVTAPLPA